MQIFDCPDWRPSVVQGPPVHPKYNNEIPTGQVKKKNTSCLERSEAGKPPGQRLILVLSSQQISSFHTLSHSGTVLLAQVPLKERILVMGL